jgi:hypothetical protein
VHANELIYVSFNDYVISGDSVAMVAVIPNRLDETSTTSIEYPLTPTRKWDELPDRRREKRFLAEK